MSFHPRFLKFIAAFALATAVSVALAPTAEARHRHALVRVAAVGPILVPAHERPGFPHATGPGFLIDLGLGPVFPFGGWPAKL